MLHKWVDMRRKLTTNALFQPKKSLFNILLLVWTEMESMTHVQGVNEIQGVFPHIAMRYIPLHCFGCCWVGRREGPFCLGAAARRKEGFLPSLKNKM